MITFLTPEEMAEYAKTWIHDRLTHDEKLKAKLSRKRFLIFLKQFRSLGNVQMSLCLFLELYRTEHGFIRQTRMLHELERKIGQSSHGDLEMLEYLQVEVSESKIISESDSKIIMTMLSKMSLRLRLESKKLNADLVSLYKKRYHAFSEFLRKSGFGARLNPPIQGFNSGAA